MYLVSIYFDERIEKELHSLIKRVARVTGNSFMLDNHVPPHITIVAVETKHEDKLLACMEQVVKQLSAGEVQFVSTGVFAQKVIFVQPVLNEYLYKLNEHFIKEFEQIEETICNHFYQPFHWLPHCTIAKQLAKEQMLQAFSVLQENFVPVKGCVTKIGVAKTNPHRDIQVWEFDVACGKDSI